MSEIYVMDSLDFNIFYYLGILMNVINSECLKINESLFFNSNEHEYLKRMYLERMY